MKSSIMMDLILNLEPPTMEDQAEINCKTTTKKQNEKWQRAYKE